MLAGVGWNVVECGAVEHILSNIVMLSAWLVALGLRVPVWIQTNVRIQRAAKSAVFLMVSWNDLLGTFLSLQRMFVGPLNPG